MTFLELCEKRFSARKFTDKPVSKEDMDYILKCVQLAPSAVNFQPWKFVIVESEEAKAKLRQAYNRDWFVTAPTYIVAYKNKQQEWVRKYDQKPHGDIDVSIAVEHICMAATDLGLGTCWVCAYNPEILAELFPQSEDFEAVAIVPIGHIANDCPVGEKKRKDISEIVERV